MKFLISFLILFFVFNYSFAQVTVNVVWTEQTKMPITETIYYKPTKKLAWTDFKGKPAPPSPVAAITSSGFGYRADMKSLDGKGTINISVYCFFNKQKSWVRSNNKTPYILEHEQHHFDATYLATKGFIENVRAAKITPENMDTILGLYYKEANAKMSKMQHDYDSETNNGIIKVKQEKWNTFFNEKLKQ